MSAGEQPYNAKNMVIAADHCGDHKCEGCPFEDFITGEFHDRCRDILFYRLGIALGEHMELTEQLDSGLKDVLEMIRKTKER